MQNINSYKESVVAIHQPDFFPWIGFFNKIARSDIMVLLDDVQFSKKGGTYTNRVSILNCGVQQWLTAPIERKYHGLRNINEMNYHKIIPWRNKCIKVIESSYRKAPFYNKVYPWLIEIIDNPECNIARYNEFAIKAICKRIGVRYSHITRSSNMNVMESSTDRLVTIVKKVNGFAYLCGGGAGGYQEDNKFINKGIEVIYQDFKHPRYKQFNTNEFVAGLSILDALFNCETSVTKEIVCSI